MLFEIRAARYSWEVKLRRRAMKASLRRTHPHYHPDDRRGDLSLVHDAPGAADCRVVA